MHTIWLCGPPASGKTTLALALSARLRQRNIYPVLLDGDVVRSAFRDEDLSHAGRARSVETTAQIAKLVNDSRVWAIVAKITPAAIMWDRLDAFEGFDHLRVYCRSDLMTRIRRDPKGLYKQADAGTITELTGYDGHYYSPEDRVDLVVDTEKRLAVCVRSILDRLKEREWL